MEDYQMHKDIFNNFIKDVEDKDISSNDKNTNKYILVPKNQNKKDEKENSNNYLAKEDNLTQYKLLKLKNELLSKKLLEKEKILRNYKKKCQEQAKKIDELKKKVTENMLKQNKEDNAKLIYEPKKGKENKIFDNKNKKELIDQIDTINYDIDNTTFFQCGICMDTFNQGEKVKRLPCEHIFHTDCMSQWIQTKNNCPFCDQTIFY